MIATFLRRLFSRGAKMLPVGSKAPDFTISAHDGTPVSLRNLAGQRVVLWFYPKADTPG